MLYSIETKTDNVKKNFSTFLIEPLDRGQGITLGNTIRRSLLSELSGLAITGTRINNVKHEFKSLSGIREDIVEILLNLKDIIIKDSFLFDPSKKSLRKQKGFLFVKGPLIVTANRFKLPTTGLQIINKNQYICTVADDSTFYCEIDIETGQGYQILSENEVETDKVCDLDTLKLDAVFTPIKKVNFKTRLINDSYGNLKESLVLEIETNGSITPKRALLEALKNILTLFSNIFMTSNLQILSSTLEENKNQSV